MPTVTVCFECSHDLEHCHGTAVVHLGESFECTDGLECTLSPDLHLFAVACEVNGCCGPERP